MSEDAKSELSDVDIEFLTVVRDVCDNPDSYDETELGKAPATAVVIRKNSSLSKGQVRYRITTDDDAGDNRGFGEDHLGYIKTYGATMNPTGWGPRSCEITQRGREVLEELSEQPIASLPEGSGAATGVSVERIEELEETVERLDNQISTIGERLTEATEAIEEFNEAEFGAVDADVKNKLESVMNAMITYNNLLKLVFGVDTDPFHPHKDEELTPEKVAEQREQILAELNATSESAAAETIRRQKQ